MSACEQTPSTSAKGGKRNYGSRCRSNLLSSDRTSSRAKKLRAASSSGARPRNGSVGPHFLKAANNAVPVLNQMAKSRLWDGGPLTTQYSNPSRAVLASHTRKSSVSDAWKANLRTACRCRTALRQPISAPRLTSQGGSQRESPQRVASRHWTSRAKPTSVGRRESRARGLGGPSPPALGRRLTLSGAGTHRAAANSSLDP